MTTSVSTPAQAVAAARAAASVGISCRPSSSCPHVHLDLRPMRAIRFYQPGDLTVGADAGCTVAELNAVLAEHHQFVPLDVADPEAATLGAVLAAHRSGPLRHRFGSVRDFTLGLEMVAADGSLVHGGGRVVKNVAGYDWMKPVIGSHGGLGIITGANFKVFPVPQGIAAAVFAPLAWPQVESLRTALLHSQLRPLAVELHARGDDRSVTVTYCGTAVVQARYRADLGRFGLPVSFADAAFPSATPAVNLCLAPAQAVSVLAALDPGAEVHGRLALGLFALLPPPPPPEILPATRALMDRLKAALDPGGLFHGNACA